MNVQQLITSVLAWASTAGVVLVLSWAFSVGAELRAVGALPTRVANIEGRLNEREIQAARVEEALSDIRRRLDQLQREHEGLRGLPR